MAEQTPDPTSPSFEYLKKRSYLTRGDKVKIALALALGIPIFALGFPYFVLLGTGAVFVSVIYALLRPAPPPPAGGYPSRSFRIARRIRPRTEIRHTHTVNTAQPGKTLDSERSPITGRGDSPR